MIEERKKPPTFDTHSSHLTLHATYQTQQTTGFCFAMNPYKEAPLSAGAAEIETEAEAKARALRTQRIGPLGNCKRGSIMSQSTKHRALRHLPAPVLRSTTLPPFLSASLLIDYRDPPVFVVPSRGHAIDLLLQVSPPFAACFWIHPDLLQSPVHSRSRSQSPSPSPNSMALGLRDTGTLVEPFDEKKHAVSFQSHAHNHGYGHGQDGNYDDPMQPQSSSHDPIHIPPLPGQAQMGGGPGSIGSGAKQSPINFPDANILFLGLRVGSRTDLYPIVWNPMVVDLESDTPSFLLEKKAFKNVSSIWRSLIPKLMDFYWDIQYHSFCIDSIYPGDSHQENILEYPFSLKIIDSKTFICLLRNQRRFIITVDFSLTSLKCQPEQSRHAFNFDSLREFFHKIDLPTNDFNNGWKLRADSYQASENYIVAASILTFRMKQVQVDMRSLLEDNPARVLSNLQNCMQLFSGAHSVFQQRVLYYTNIWKVLIDIALYLERFEDMRESDVYTNLYTCLKTITKSFSEITHAICDSLFSHVSESRNEVEALRVLGNLSLQIDFADKLHRLGYVYPIFEVLENYVSHNYPVTASMNPRKEPSKTAESKPRPESLGSATLFNQSIDDIPTSTPGRSNIFDPGLNMSNIPRLNLGGPNASMQAGSPTDTSSPMLKSTQIEIPPPVAPTETIIPRLPLSMSQSTQRSTALSFTGRTRSSRRINLADPLANSASNLPERDVLRAFGKRTSGIYFTPSVITLFQIKRLYQIKGQTDQLTRSVVVYDDYSDDSSSYSDVFLEEILRLLSIVFGNINCSSMADASNQVFSLLNYFQTNFWNESSDTFTNVRAYLYQLLRQINRRWEFTYRFVVPKILSDLSIDTWTFDRRIKANSFIRRIYSEIHPYCELHDILGNAYQISTLFHILAETVENSFTSVTIPLIINSVMNRVLDIQSIVFKWETYHTASHDLLQLADGLLHFISSFGSCSRNHESKKLFNHFMNEISHTIGFLQQVIPEYFQLKTYRGECYGDEFGYPLLLNYIRFLKIHIPRLSSIEEKSTIAGLFEPEEGLISMLLRDSDDEMSIKDLHLRLEFLNLFDLLCRFQHCRLFQNKAWVDYWVNFNYVSFTRTYFGTNNSIKIRPIMHAHLRILISLCERTDEVVAEQLYQLKVIDFLYKEFNLEYFIWLSESKEKHVLQPKSSSPPFIYKYKNQKTDESEDFDDSDDSDDSDFDLAEYEKSLLENPHQRSEGAAQASESFGQPRKIVIPGLSLPSTSTKDGENKRGTDMQLVYSDELKPTGHVPIEKEAESSEIGKLEPQLRKSTGILKIPGLSLTKDVTKDGVNLQGGDTKVSFDSSSASSIPKVTKILTFKSPPESPVAAPGTPEAQESQFFSNLEAKMDLRDPKLQLFLTPKPITTTTVFDQINPKHVSVRKSGIMYTDVETHALLLELVFSLLLTNSGTLNLRYNDQFPISYQKVNMIFILHKHLNSKDNLSVVEHVQTRFKQEKPNMYRLLKLLCASLFNPALYSDEIQIASGAFGTVYRCKSPIFPDDVAVKKVPTPKNIQDRCSLFDIFTEILIMDQHNGDPRICHMVDYGVTDTNYFIVMRRYQASLKTWRAQQPLEYKQHTLHYLQLYSRLLKSFIFLKENNINHFDIKCDNILAHPSDPKASPEQFYKESLTSLNMTLHISDFGESIVYSNEEDCFATKNSGTEFIKSPEMLGITYSGQKSRVNFDRRKKIGAGPASDVWSATCLLYELIVGDFLFYDDDWMRFYIRVTGSDQELIPPERLANFEYCPKLIQILNYGLIRDPLRRPSMRDLAKFTAHVFEQLCGGISVPRQVSRTELYDVMSLRPSPSGVSSLGSICMCSYNLFIGSSVVLDSLGTLQPDFGITHIVLCNLRQTLPFYESLQISLATTSVSSKDIQTVMDVLEFIESALKIRGKILICCETGITWAPFFIACYLILKLGFAPNIVMSEFYLPSGIGLSDESVPYFQGVVKTLQTHPIRFLHDTRDFYQCVCGRCSFYVDEEYLNKSGYYDHDMAIELQSKTFVSVCKDLHRDVSFQSYSSEEPYKWVHIDPAFVEKRFETTNIKCVSALPDWQMECCARCDYPLCGVWTQQRTAFNTTLPCAGILWDRRPSFFHRNRYSGSFS